VSKVVDRITGDGTFRALLARVRQAAPAEGVQGAVIADGLWGSFAPILAGAVARELNRPLLFVTAHLDEADEARDDFELFLGQAPELLSAFETAPGEGAASDEIHAERIRLCSLLEDHANQPSDHKPFTIVTPIQALMQSVPNPEALKAAMFTLTVGQEQDPRKLADWLVDHGFTRLDLVETPGDFALRGDILDIWPPAEPDPYRLDFFDDTIESIRRIDIGTQRSRQTLDSVRIAGLSSVSLKESQKANRYVGGKITSFLSYLPAETIIAFNEPVEIQELGHTFWDRLNRPTSMMPVDKVYQRSGVFTQLHLYNLPAAVGEQAISFGVRSLTRFETKTTEALQELADLAIERHVVLYCDNEPERERFIELWNSTIGELPASLELIVGLMHHGFDWPEGKLAVVGHHELFHRYQQRRRMRKTHAARPIDSWLDLQNGDYVVHVTNGIARFCGMRTMQKGQSGKAEEYLTLEFADKAKLYVPVTQIDLVQKYIGAAGIKPQLSKLGGTRWAKTKEKVEESVSELATELLRIQARRASQTGIGYPDDTLWQREFEGSFIYTETEDQLIALAEIKRSMRKEQPMDLLLCGDVGYGKTELAMRAAFKAVEYGKQVAVLVPTTVLAEQHERTFRERFADYPFLIEGISRFKTPKQQKGVLERTRQGQVDVLIGTHRLLSKDIGFKDLGLLVVDEEQRFGVEHKERIKRLRSTVDILTMSATPIPRTLHMSLLGIRDISSLATPPMDRRSIVTRVSHWDDKLIREAILREMNRNGQIYFVHNFVYDIKSFADRVQQIVPEARIVVGHGQMKQHGLEKVMRKFLHHEADVLISTTIIESGLDIPNCNTILIDRADRFGLSELHQLRGRVGRYKHRAYCYLLLSPGKPITSTAARRLKAIEEFSDLGAGFRIAMRDLEIRGAGNILGAEQSGHIAAVGYELYCQLLEHAIKDLKNEPIDTFEPVHLELKVPAHIPRNYIDSDRQRMEIYRRLARCQTRSELIQLESDIKDAFGDYPQPVQTLLDLAEIRVLAQPFRIKSITQEEPDLIFRIRELPLVEPLFANSPGSPRMPDGTTIHLRLSEGYFEPDTLLAVLRRMLTSAETEKTATV